MLRVAIRATPDTDVDAEIQGLRQAAQNARLEEALIERIVGEADTVIRDFVSRGRELRALGSHLKANRAIQGDGYDIRVSFDTAQRSGLIGRVLAAFRR
jgi:hypothetical protein